MAKIPMESLDFEAIWESWMSVKDRRFQEWFRLWVSDIFLRLLSCCPRDYHWYQYVEMSLPFQPLYLKPTKVHVHAQIQWIHISIYEKYEIVNKQWRESR
jgi:hypothetical protein